MKTISTVAGSTAIALLLGASASMAQGVLTGTDALDNRIDDIEENVQDDFENS